MATSAFGLERRWQSSLHQCYRSLGTSENISLMYKKPSCRRRTTSKYYVMMKTVANLSNSSILNSNYVAIYHRFPEAGRPANTNCSRRKRLRSLLCSHLELSTSRSASPVTEGCDVWETLKSLYFREARTEDVYFALYKCAHYSYYCYYYPSKHMPHTNLTWQQCYYMKHFCSVFLPGTFSQVYKYTGM